MTQTVTLEGLRSQMLTSIHGRRLGLDPNNMLVGPTALRGPVTSYTATTANTGYPITTPYGIVTLVATTAASNWTMDPPAPGTEMWITNNSTGGPKITLNSGTLLTSTGNDATIILFTASSSGQTANLIGLSTSLTLLMKPSTGITAV